MIRSISFALLSAVTGGFPVAHATDTCMARSAEMLQSFRKGDYQAVTTHFDDTMKAALDAQKLSDIWQQQLPGAMGAFDRSAETQAQRQGSHTIATTPLHFANGWLSMKVACNADGHVTGLFFAPGQAPSAAALSSDIDAKGASNHALAVLSPLGPLPGTLVLPAGDGPFPTVLLLAGSGPQDRDETIGPNAPLRDLAEALAAAHIASFRYEKRTHVYGQQMAGKAVTVDDEVTDDAITALHLLAQQPHVDPHRLFVLGHSLGALMAPRIGQRDRHLAGLVLLAAPAAFDLDTVLRQMRYIGQQQGVSAAVLAKQMAPIVQARDAMAHADPTHPPMGSFFHAPASYWLSLRDYNAVDVAKTLHEPMLVLQGSGDYQVTPAHDFSQWQAAFTSSVRVKLREYPGLSHLFMPAGTPPSPTDYDKAGHVDPRVLGDIVTWIRAQPASA
jgi:uncharacterized protein